MSLIRKSTVRRFVLLVLPLGVVGGALYVADKPTEVLATSVATSCYGSLTATTYPGGVATASLASNTSVAIASNGLQLNTNLTPFNAQNITLPFDQQLNVKFVYRNAGASHSFGWFYLDQISQFFNTDGTLKDQDGDGISDWFQTAKGATRPNTGLWGITTGSMTLPDLYNSATGYSDGGTYPHIPNILETLGGPGKGLIIFKLCDDDGDTSTYGVGSTAGSYPISDVSTAADGIPDYDVNGDGIVGNAADRAVNLGIVQGNREIVFWAVTYYSAPLPNSGLGTSKTGSTTGSVFPFFTKNILNPDKGQKSAGTILQKIALKCKPAESTNDSACWSPLGGTNGFLTPEAQTRLNTAIYNNVDLSADPSVVTVKVASDASAPHFVVLPPASNPNLWLIGYEDLPSSSSDEDFNDVVFMIERANGGQVISNVVSNIPAAQLTTTAISSVHVTYNATFPAPGCTGVAAQINLYYSVDNGVTWNAVPEASLTSGDVTIDVLGAGIIGSQLKWRADFVSPVQACQPTLTSFNIGYEAVSNGIYKYAAPIPLSNIVYSGALETPPYPATEPAVTSADFSLRGHFFANELYNPSSQTVTITDPLASLRWDSGALVSSTDPTNRPIWTSVGGVLTAFSTTNGATLYPLVLPTASRTAMSNATLVYDYNGDNVVNDVDARYLVEWTRGWEYPAGVTFTPAPSAQPQQRGWKLGAVHNSSPAIIGPPIRPSWIDGFNAPATLISKHNAFRLANAGRLTRSVVGSQDGMIHAFDSGEYRPGNDAAASGDVCVASLLRGCYAGAETGNPSAYGTGKEVWTWLPPSQLSQLKNNNPHSRTYLSGSNPQGEVDGSVSVEDIWDPSITGGGSFRTMAFASLGTSQRYVTAVDMSADTPKAMWAADFTDADYNGSNLSPSVGLVETGSVGTNGLTYREMVVVSSGLASALEDEFVYLLDALTGTLVKKIQLNTAPYAAQSTGIASYTSLLDADADGLIDRAYNVDTAGRIWKVDLTTNAKCLVASVGETVYSGLAVQLANGASSTSPKVSIFVGGGSNPDGTGTAASLYHVFAYEDDDPVGTCTNGLAKVVYTKALATGEKIWAAPTVNDTQVFFAAANATSSSICAGGSGALYTLSTTGTGGVPTSSPSPQAITGAPISSLRVYDGHIVVNTIGGSTTVLGSGRWNLNSGNGASAGGSTANGLIGTMKTLLWQEL